MSPTLLSPRKHNLDRRAEKLAAQGDGHPDDLLDTKVADWLGVSPQWVEIGRVRGYGPRFTKIGPQLIRYRRADVIAWLEERVHARTAEYTKPNTHDRGGRRPRANAAR